MTVYVLTIIRDSESRPHPVIIPCTSEAVASAQAKICLAKNQETTIATEDVFLDFIKKLGSKKATTTTKEV